MRTPKQFNNITERVIDDLKQVLSSGNSQISIAAASFSIYVYEALKEELEKVDCVTLFLLHRHSGPISLKNKKESSIYPN